jgi:hypothetical protein
MAKARPLGEVHDRRRMYKPSNVKQIVATPPHFKTGRDILGYAVGLFLVDTKILK